LLVNQHAVYKYYWPVASAESFALAQRGMVQV
jgi:hypothetical protein